jgi:hypothetical protein
MISQERMNKALTYLAETDEECAVLRADHARAEFKAKSIRNTIILAGQGSVADRTAAAECSDEYSHAKRLEFDAFMLYEAMKNKRATECIVIDTWRSLNAARNKGQIV